MRRMSRANFISVGLPQHAWFGRVSAMPLSREKLVSMMIVDLPRQRSPNYFEGGHGRIHRHHAFYRKAIQILRVSDLH